MYNPIPKGSIYTIVDAYGTPIDCHLPPKGYGINSITGEIEKTDIIKRSAKAEEQFWQREGLPDWWEAKRATEIDMEEDRIAKGSKEEYIDADCEELRSKWWGRRLRGVWFWNNGSLTYITGRHWMLLETWIFQGKYFDFRIPDMEFFYFTEYCYWDPNCLGEIEITKRRQGKSARAGMLLYEYVSRSDSKHGGIQSKTDPDAGEVFQKAVVGPWQKLPDFFRPTFDDIKGDNPEKEMRFFNSSRKGRSIKTKKTEKALESWIDFKPRGVYSYDGSELHWYVSDEAGKNKDVSILERHNVVRFCSELDGEFIGFQHYTTTVEDMLNGGGEFEELVKMSDRRKLGENKRTASGLYVYFMPAYRTLYFDKYGFADEERARKYYEMERKNLESRPREFASYVRKNPFTLQECFQQDGDKCLYNPMKLNSRLSILTWRENLTERGRFAWKNGERFTEVEWIKDRTGRFEMVTGFEMKNANAVTHRNDHHFPANTFNFRMGCDPFKYDKTKDNRRSNCAASVYKMHDVADKDNPLNDAFVCRYVHRADTTKMQYEDTLMMAWYFGCQVLFESNVDNWKDYYSNAKCYGFLMVLPGEKEPGIYSDGQGQTHQQIANYTEAYIENFIDRVYFKEKIEGWLKFDVGDTTKFDECMADGYTLIAVNQKKYTRETTASRDVTDFFTQYSVA